MTLLFVDIETYSSVDLIKYGVYAYSEAPDFEVMMCAWSDGGEVQLAIGRTEIDVIPGLWDDSVTKVAHNAQFERVCFSRFKGLPVDEFLEPACWLDTAALAAEHGYPRSLKELAKALGAEEKDEAGTRLINMFCKPQKAGRLTEVEKPEQWQEFCDYCIQDVRTLVDIFNRLPDWPTDTERRLFEVDQKINDRGIFVDLELARYAVEAGKVNYTRDAEELQDLLGIDNAGSVVQIQKALVALGVRMLDVRSDTVKELLSGSTLDPIPRRALELRQSLALVAAKKYETAIYSASPDSRLRGSFRFYGAHTGRWSGRGVQLQNLPRASVDHVESAIFDLKMGHGADAETMKGLVRSLFVGPFTVVDYSAIEARVLAWIAGEQWVLDAFLDNRDIYVETANRMGGLTRQQGKIAVLASGYQGGINALRNMGGDALGSDAFLQEMVQLWRKANPRIVRFWRMAETAFLHGGDLGKLQIECVGKDRRVVLPSGRTIMYRGIKVVSDGHFQRITFNDPRNPKLRAETYGGRQTENYTQAISRDLLADALIQLEDAGYRTVAHVHDEVLVESDDVVGIEKIITTNPLWAEGLPLAAEGFQCYRYQK